jgi:hypothetical protein
VRCKTLSLTAVSCWFVVFLASMAQTHDPVAANPATTQKKSTRLYVIHVIDISSKAPISNAKVTVELDNAAKTKWTGSTDAKGLFQFRWDAVTASVKAHISVQAQGFSSLDDFNLLMEDRVFELTKAD